MPDGQEKMKGSVVPLSFDTLLLRLAQGSVCVHQGAQLAWEESEDEDAAPTDGVRCVCVACSEQSWEAVLL